MKFRSFVALFLSVVMAISVFTIVGMSMLQNGYDTTSSETDHFSVTWMGFSPPDYSNQYPDYYICINNLADDPLAMQIALQIKNQEDSGYYFLIEQYTAPPAGWTISPYYIGYVSVDETKTFTYEDVTRSKPTSIAGGRLTESVDLVVKAYWDAAYTSFYSQDNFTATFHFIDRTSAVWTQLNYDNFDDGTTQQWDWTGDVSWGGFDISSKYYRSFQYSLRLYGTQAVYYDYAYRKSFETTGPFSEAYLIYSLRSGKWPSDPKILLDGTKYFAPDMSPTTNVWYQFTIPLPTGTTTEIQIWAADDRYDVEGESYLDDVYVIAK